MDDVLIVRRIPARAGAIWIACPGSQRPDAMTTRTRPPRRARPICKSLFLGDRRRGETAVSVAVDVVVAIAQHTAPGDGLPAGRVAGHLRPAEPNDRSKARQQAGSAIVGGNGTDHHDIGPSRACDDAEADEGIVGGDAVHHRGIDRPHAYVSVHNETVTAIAVRLDPVEGGLHQAYRERRDTDSIAAVIGNNRVRYGEARGTER